MFEKAHLFKYKNWPSYFKLEHLKSKMCRRNSIKRKHSHKGRHGHCGGYAVSTFVIVPATTITRHVVSYEQTSYTGSYGYGSFC